MKYLTAKDFTYLLTGSIFYGTGGGGSPQLGRQIYRKIIKEKQKVRLVSMAQFNSDDTFITAFAVGGLNQTSLPSKQIRKGLKLLQNQIAQPIKGIISVEIGPLATAIAANLAAELKLPLIDADFVGGRSSPEVFLETISLFNIKRTPLVVVNTKNDVAVLANSSDFYFEENWLRTFASISKETGYVLGYPIKQKLAKKSLCLNTVSQAIKVGQRLLKKEVVGKIMFSGKIVKIKNLKTAGFSAKKIYFQNKTDTAKLYLKNENLIFWINNQPVLTCPDLIILTDTNNQPLYNLDLKNNLNVKVIGIPAQLLWRTKKGLRLFNPKLFGYNIKQKLL